MYIYIYKIGWMDGWMDGGRGEGGRYSLYGCISDRLIEGRMYGRMNGSNRTWKISNVSHFPFTNGRPIYQSGLAIYSI